jgi:hypothetical protein
MKIKYLASSPKNGTVEHVRNDVGLTLIAAGFAETVPLPKRGSPGWLEARQEQSALATGPSAGDAVASTAVITAPRFKQPEVDGTNAAQLELARARQAEYEASVQHARRF